MYRRILLLLSSLLICACANNSNSSILDSSNSLDIQSSQNEGKLYIPRVELYMDMDPQRIDVYMDKKLSLDVDLYYDIMDEDICDIIDGYAYPLKVGNTQVFASTISGQEVEFKVTVLSEMEQKFDKILRAHEDKIRTDSTYKSNKATMFVGDSYFDELFVWKTFSYDWSDYNCKSLGMSGSQASDWMFFKKRLFKDINPKNVIIHLGTNDINDTGVLKTVDEYYDVVTRFLGEFCQEHPTTNVYFISIENRTYGAAGRNFYSEAVTNKIKDEFIESMDNLFYVDTATYINAHQEECFLEDGVHLNQNGYKYYVETLKKVVDFE